MTEPVRTPAPKGLQRLVRVSTIQHGTKFVSEKLNSELISLQELIYNLLKNQGMTTRELIGCLLSEPYNLLPNSLESIAIVLDNLGKDNLLAIGFRVNDSNFDVEPVFQTL